MEFRKTSDGARVSACGMYYICVNYWQPVDSNGSPTGPEEAIYVASYLGKEDHCNLAHIRADRRDLEAKQNAARECLAACDAHASKMATQPSGK